MIGASSAASSEIECHVNEHVKQALELEDPVDLRQHNKGHSSKYTQFWEACEVIFKGILKQQLMTGDMILLSIWVWPCLPLGIVIK